MQKLLIEMEARLNRYELEAARAERQGDQSDKIEKDARASELARCIFDIKQEVKRGNVK